MNPMRVLVVEDDRELCEVMQEGLAREGFQVDRASSGQEALERATGSAYDVILLDVMIPRPDGYAVLAQLRKQGNRSAILMVTSRGEEKDKLKGLSGGADDYLVKPFSLAILAAHLRSVMRRREPKAELFREGDLQVDMSARRVRRGPRDIALSSTEYRLLLQLVRGAGRVIPKKELTERVWGYDFGGSANVLEVYIGYLRDKLEAAGEPRLIHTVRGAGYTLRATL